MEMLNNLFSWFPFIVIGIMLHTFIPIIVVIIIVVSKINSQRKFNNRSPRLTVNAVVLSKRTHMDMHSYPRDTVAYHSASTNYFATFQFDSGDRMEFMLSGQDFGYLIEGDRGLLTFQGTRYLSFERTYF